jgi:hypothetical protein
MDEQSSPTKTRRGRPKAEPKQKNPEQPETGYSSDIERLEACLSKLAVMAGQGNILAEFGIDRWVPGKNDMRKYKQ